MLKTVKIFGISIVVISFLLLIAFFATLGLGAGTIDSTAGEAMHVPLLTDAVFLWTYILFAAAIVAAFAAAVYKFIKSSISNPRSALRAVIPLLLFVGIFVVSFFMGSGERMEIIGYEGTQNEGIWAQVTDMFIYTTYTLLVLIILSIVGSKIYTALK
ncbi:MAG: hypothetical protein ACOX7E_02000 [Paludibacter sp.]|jgi:hypothetical protein|nr:hypothetical protein [Bacteroidales bacterium]HOG05017.1 hypothetical protein [Paludibacter sp.]HOS45542.1 hypothetical protein [Paludibacter sp.]HPM08939.1 hypothetical protein [Paludibacter sp.]